MNTHVNAANGAAPDPATGSAVCGVNHSRTKCADTVGRLEKALAERWASDNQPRYWLNGGRGTLENILKREPTEQDMIVAASVVQWMGTNCGRWFLRDAAEDAGWTISAAPNNDYAAGRCVSKPPATQPTPSANDRRTGTQAGER